MLGSTLDVTLRLLQLRSGPQDLPYVPAATPALIALAITVQAVRNGLVVPAPAALMEAASMYAGLVLLTRELLKARKLENRYHQTLQALLLTGIACTLLQLWPFARIAPALAPVLKNPALLDHPEMLPVPQFAALLFNAFMLLRFVVSAHIYRHAFATGFGVGVLVALMSEFVQLSIMALGSSLLQLVAG